MKSSLQPKRWWHRVRLASSLALLLFLAAYLGLAFVPFLTRVMRQRAAVQAAERLGGTVFHDHIEPPGGGVRPPSESSTRTVLRRLLGDDMFSKVSFVSLGRPNVKDSDMEMMADLIQGKCTLTLGGSQVTDLGLKSIAKATPLDSLSLGRTKVTDKGLEQLVHLSKLQRLWLNSTDISDAGMNSLLQLPLLTLLDLSDTAITDGGMATLGKLTQLTVLHLDNTRISDLGIKHLAGMKQLRELSIKGTNVTEAGLVYLEALDRLGHLDISGIKLEQGRLERLRQTLPNCGIAHEFLER